MAAQELYKKRAVIKDGTQKVLSVINVPDAYSINGYHLVEVKSNVCHKGMYHNPADDVFYDDAAFTTISGIPVGQIDSSDQPET